MKKIYFNLTSFALASISIAFAACTNEPAALIDQAESNAPIIYASQELQAKSSITVDGEGVGTIYWSPADNISIFYGASTPVLYTSTNLAPETTAAFTTSAIIGSTELASTNIWGLYPHNPSAVCDGASISTTLPSTQYGVSGTFDDDLFMTVAHSDDTNLHFYNVCGGIKFSLSRNDITSITFAGNNNEDIAGDITVSFVEGLPSVSVDRGEKTITVTPKGGGTFASDTYYYIIALPQTLSNGFTMTFETATQLGTFEYNAKAVTIKRSVFGKKDDIDGYAEYSIPANQIIYTSFDGSLVETNRLGTIITNEYIDGKGIMTFQYNVTFLSNYAFQGKNNLTSIELPNSITTFYDDTFYGCTKLTSIRIPDSVTSIGTSTFFQCSSLTNVRLSNSMTSIPSMTFAWCTKLSSVIIPESVTHIGSNAFRMCTGLTKVTIPDNVTRIDNAAFLGCTGITSIVIPEKVATLGYDLFEGCSKLNSITFLSMTPPEGENIFTDTTCPIYVPASSIELYKNTWIDYADRIFAIN